MQEHERTIITLGILGGIAAASRVLAGAEPITLRLFVGRTLLGLRKTVVAHVFGERTMATLGRLMSLLSPFDVVIWMTDGWPLYESRLKGKLHVISKRYTQRIERHNLNLRQHLARRHRDGNNRQPEYPLYPSGAFLSRQPCGNCRFAVSYLFCFCCVFCGGNCGMDFGV